MDPGEPIERLSPACRQCLCPTFWPGIASPEPPPHSSHQVSRLCHPESRPVRRQRTWKRFTKQTPTDPPGATRKFYSVDRGSCPCRMEGSDALTRRCRPMPSLAPRLSARPSPPWGFRPRVPGTDQPFTASLVCGLSRSATSPRAHTAWAGPRSLALTTCSAGGGSTSGRASSTGDHTLGCRSRRSSADPLGPPTSPPCHQHAACSKPRGPARRRCTALVRLVRESRPTALVMRCTSRSWTPNNSGMARVCASASPAGSEGRPGSKQVKLSRPARRQCLCGECHRPPLDFATPPGESDPRWPSQRRPQPRWPDCPSKQASRPSPDGDCGSLFTLHAQRTRLSALNQGGLPMAIAAV